MSEIKVIDVREDVQRFNAYESKIEALEAHRTLKINGIEDKEGAKVVRTARIECKNIMTAIEKDRKLVKAPVLELSKAIDERAKEFSNSALEIRQIMEAEEKAVSDELEAIAEAERIKEEAKKQERINLMNSLGVTFTGFSYIIGDTSIMLTEINQLSDEDFKSRFVEMEIEDNLIKEAEVERKILEEAEAVRLKKEREEQEKKQAEIDAQLKELAEIKAEQKRKEDELKAEEDRVKLFAKKSKDDSRIKKITEIGWKFDGEEFSFKESCIALERVCAMSDTEFHKTLNEATELKLKTELAEKEAAEKAKVESEKQRVADAKKSEADKKAAVQKAKEEEAERIHQERLEIDRKAKERREAEERKARLAPDKEKLVALNDIVLAIQLPEMTTEEGKETIDKIRGQFAKMTAWMHIVTEKL